MFIFRPTFLAVLDPGMDVKGGGEILQVEIPESEWTNYVDWNLVKQFQSIPLIFLAAIVTAIIVLTLIQMRANNMTGFTMYGVSYSLAKRKKGIKKNRLIAVNQFIRNLTSFVERSPFRCDKNNKDYMDYNLKRAGLMLPGKQPMYYEQYNALKLTVTAFLVLLSLVIALFVNTSIGVIMFAVTVWISAFLPMLLIRGIVEHKDTEIKNHFMDFYLILHYALLMHSSTPLAKLMHSYTKTTDNVIMHQFVAECVNTLDTFGEYNAPEIIARDYREIAQVGKLMRLVKQLHDGANVKQELKGFRAELVRDEQFRINEVGNKKVMKVRSSFMLVYIFLFQVILSTMAIYLPDIMGGANMLGG